MALLAFAEARRGGKFAAIAHIAAQTARIFPLHERECVQALSTAASEGDEMACVRQIGRLNAMSGGAETKELLSKFADLVARDRNRSVRNASRRLRDARAAGPDDAVQHHALKVVSSIRRGTITEVDDDLARRVHGAAVDLIRREARHSVTSPGPVDGAIDNDDLFSVSMRPAILKFLRIARADDRKLLRLRLWLGRKGIFSPCREALGACLGRKPGWVSRRTTFIRKAIRRLMY